MFDTPLLSLKRARKEDYLVNFLRFRHVIGFAIEIVMVTLLIYSHPKKRLDDAKYIPSEA